METLTMANTDHARKLLVRTALVTSTTIATLVGAQNFAMLDARSFYTPEEIPSNEVVVVAPLTNDVPTTILRTEPNITILHRAPNITILRQSGEVNTASVATRIQPPAPSQIAAPAPVIVQQPIPQRSRASR